MISKIMLRCCLGKEFDLDSWCRKRKAFRNCGTRWPCAELSKSWNWATSSCYTVDPHWTVKDEIAIYMSGELVGQENYSQRILMYA